MEKKKNKTLYTCLGCGCGTLIFVAIVVAVVAIFFGDNISNVFNGFSNPEEMTYQGKKVTTLAEEQRLYYDSDGNVPRTDGTYKNKKNGVGLRFKDKFRKNSTSTGSVELFLIDNPQNKLKFKATSCGCSLYDITDDQGKRWGFATVGKDATVLFINDNGYIVSFEFNRDPKKDKKEK